MVRRVMPNHALGVAERTRERRWQRRIEGGIGLCEAAQRARTGMRSRRSRLILEAGALLACAMTDDGGLERIGNGLTGRPARGNRRQYLHRQGEQDDG